MSVYQPPSSPVPSIHAPSPLFSGLRPNTTLRKPPASIFGEHHASDSEDEESIESNQSGLAMIPPCTDYSRYSYWLKKHFPHQMTKSNMNFVENILEIKDLSTALKFKAFQPKDWRVFLGKYLYQRYLKVIADLAIIWSATLGLPHSICYAEYCDIKDQVYDHVINELKKQVDSSSDQSVTSKLKPPPYTKVSPVVQKFQMEDQMSTSSRPQKSSKSSRKTYKTIAPNPVDSIGVPVVNAYAAPDSMSVSTKSDSDDETSWHDLQVSARA